MRNRSLPSPPHVADRSLSRPSPDDASTPHAARVLRLTAQRVFVVGWLLLAPAFLLGSGIGISGAEAGTRNESSTPAPRAEDPGERLLLVELFTSQGCSSCPPADRLLRELGERPGVVPLAFHVDYWNHLGWTDPFSSPKWSDRQRRYARWFDEDTIYTPQLVVGGSRHVVGSDRRNIDRALDRERQGAPSAEAPMRTRLTVERGDRRLDARLVAHDALPPDHRIHLALYERNLEIRIGRGENSGRTLEYDYVVRAFRAVSSGEATTFHLDPQWKADDLGVVAFLQDTTTGAVHSVTHSPAPGSRR